MEAPTNFQERIETFMKGKNSFVISLGKPTQGKIQGATAQSGNMKKNLEVMPDVDKIDFSSVKDGDINVTYTRVYSDFPSSVHDFKLSEVVKVEEEQHKPK